MATAADDSWNAYKVCLVDGCKTLVKAVPDVLKLGLPSWLVSGVANIAKAQNTFTKTLPMLEAEEKSLKYYAQMLGYEVQRMKSLKLDCWYVVQNAEYVLDRASKILKGIRTSGKVIWVDEKGDPHYDKNTVMRMFKPEAYLLLVRTYIGLTSNALSEMKLERLRFETIQAIADEKHRNDRRSAYFNECAQERQNPLNLVATSKRRRPSGRRLSGVKTVKKTKTESPMKLRRSTRLAMAKKRQQQL